jgi:hypothetical protein
MLGLKDGEMLGLNEALGDCEGLMDGEIDGENDADGD